MASAHDEMREVARLYGEEGVRLVFKWFASEHLEQTREAMADRMPDASADELDTLAFMAVLEGFAAISLGIGPDEAHEMVTRVAGLAMGWDA